MTNRLSLTETFFFFNFVSQTALSGSINANKTNQLSQTVCSSEFHHPGFTVCFVTDIWLLASLGRCVGWPVPGYYCGFLYCKCRILLAVIGNVSWGNSQYFATPLSAGFAAKSHLRTKQRNSILITHHLYPYQDSASDWLKRISNKIYPLLDSDASSVSNFWSPSLDISQQKEWWGHKTWVVFSSNN